MKLPHLTWKTLNLAFTHIYVHIVGTFVEVPRGVDRDHVARNYILQLLRTFMPMKLHEGDELDCALTVHRLLGGRLAEAGYNMEPEEPDNEALIKPIPFGNTLINLLDVLLDNPDIGPRLTQDDMDLLDNLRADLMALRSGVRPMLQEPGAGAPDELQDLRAITLLFERHGWDPEHIHLPDGESLGQTLRERS